MWQLRFLTTGAWPEEGYGIDHVPSCDVNACVNPAHLFPGHAYRQHARYGLGKDGKAISRILNVLLRGERSLCIQR